MCGNRSSSRPAFVETGTAPSAKTWLRHGHRCSAWRTREMRAAYGKGIRPPPPSARQSIATLRFRQKGNPGLEAETQSGVEAGVEWFAGDRAMVSVTGYTQVAKGLIQQVIEDRRTITYQNAGHIAN